MNVSHSFVFVVFVNDGAIRKSLHVTMFGTKEEYIGWQLRKKSQLFHPTT